MRRDEESLFFWLEQNRLMEKMEADVKRGNALQRLIAEERAANPVQNETQLKGEAWAL